ncbi:MAG: alpha/beta fold hydrolase [Pseudorhodobacter sp.]
MPEDIYYRVTGTAGDLPDLVFVHGFLCDHRDWDLLVTRLSDRFRCIVLDLPGHGNSTDPHASMMNAGKTVNAVRRAAGSHSAILIGHSLGTKIIREAYRQDPQGICGQVLIDGSLYVSDRETMLKNAHAAIANGIDAFRSALFGRMFTDRTTPEQRTFLLDRAHSVDPDFARAFFLDSVDWDTRFALTTLDMLDVPGLVIQATTFDSQFRWRSLPPGGSTDLIDAMRDRLEDFELVVIPDTGHFVMTEEPESTAAAIARFVERIGTPARTTTT